MISDVELERLLKAAAVVRGLVPRQEGLMQVIDFAAMCSDYVPALVEHYRRTLDHQSSLEGRQCSIAPRI